MSATIKQLFSSVRCRIFGSAKDVYEYQNIKHVDLLTLTKLKWKCWIPQTGIIVIIHAEAGTSV